MSTTTSSPDASPDSGEAEEAFRDKVRDLISEMQMGDASEYETLDAICALAASPASLSGGEAIRFYKLPFTLHEPKGDGAAYIRDADGGAVAMLMWPGHSLEDTDAATEETYRIGRAMAAALPSPEAPANRQEAGERCDFDFGLCRRCGRRMDDSNRQETCPAARTTLTSPKDVKGGGR